MKNLEAWKQHQGRVYSVQDIKLPYLVPLLRTLNYGVDDPVLIDVGSGYPSVAEMTRLAPPRRFSVANIDIAIGDRSSARVMDLPVDVEKLLSGEEPVAYEGLKEFLCGRSASGRPEADGIVYSDILNYVDYKTTIAGFDTILRTGGFVVVANMPGRGIGELFSDDGVQSNSELLRFCEQDLGYNISRLSYPLPEVVGDTGFLLAAFQKATDLQ